MRICPKNFFVSVFNANVAKKPNDTAKDKQLRAIPKTPFTHTFHFSFTKKNFLQVIYTIFALVFKALLLKNCTRWETSKASGTVEKLQFLANFIVSKNFYKNDIFDFATEFSNNCFLMLS